MPRFILDTNLYIQADRDAGRARELERFSTGLLPQIHFHTVVAQDLLAGTIDHGRERIVEDGLIGPFQRRGRIITLDSSDFAVIREVQELEYATPWPA